MPEDAIAVMPEAPVADTPEIAPEIPESPAPETPAVEPEQPQPEVPTEPESPEPPAPEIPKDQIPAALSKALRELKQAHPEQASALKTLGDEFHAARAYRSVFPSPDEARTVKATLDTYGGVEGLAKLQSEADSINAFDQMAAKGDPNVMTTLAEQFPDGFKRLVPHALEKLQQLDPQAYIETLRGPYLAFMQGDGLVDEIGIALEELKNNESQRAMRSLNRIAGYIDQVKRAQADFSNRRSDPRLAEIEQREAKVKSETEAHTKQRYTQEISSYVTSSVESASRQRVTERKLSADGGRDFRNIVIREMSTALGSNQHFMNTVNNLLARGDVDGAVRFAKPYIDQQRQPAVDRVWTRLYGAAPTQAKPAAVGRQAAPRGQAQPQGEGNERPSPLLKAPKDDDIDWKRTPQLLYMTHKAYLKSGRMVSWPWA